jgi:hypothetical protein
MLLFQPLHGLFVRGGREGLHHVPIEGFASKVAEAIDDALTKEERWILSEVAKGELSAAARFQLEGAEDDVAPRLRVGRPLEEGGQLTAGRHPLDASGQELR